MLIEAGADPDRRYPNGEAPLHASIRTGGNRGKVAVAEALLAGGADPCIRDAQGFYPYSIATEGGPIHRALDRAGGHDLACQGQGEAVALDSDERRRVQEALAGAGFDPGPVDGKFGPATRRAIEAWQLANGHAATGELTSRQVEALITEAMRDGERVAEDAEACKQRAHAAAAAAYDAGLAVYNARKPDRAALDNARAAQAIAIEKKFGAHEGWEDVAWGRKKPKDATAAVRREDAERPFSESARYWGVDVADLKAAFVAGYNAGYDSRAAGGDRYDAYADGLEATLGAAADERIAAEEVYKAGQRAAGDAAWGAFADSLSTAGFRFEIADAAKNTAREADSKDAAIDAAAAALCAK